MVQFEGVSYLLVALGDGTLFYFNIDPSSGKHLIVTYHSIKYCTCVRKSNQSEKASTWY